MENSIHELYKSSLFFFNSRNDIIIRAICNPDGHDAVWCIMHIVIDDKLTRANVLIIRLGELIKGLSEAAEYGGETAGPAN